MSELLALALEGQLALPQARACVVLWPLRCGKPTTTVQRPAMSKLQLLLLALLLLLGVVVAAVMLHGLMPLTAPDLDQPDVGSARVLQGKPPETCIILVT